MPLEQFRFLIPGFRDIIEILIVAYVLYRVLLFLAGTRALQILIGLVVLGLVYFVALALKFNMITSLLGVVFTYGAFAAIVVFQPELRHALSRLGRTRAMQFLAPQGSQGIVEEIVYRGFVLWYLGSFMPLWVAVAVSSAGFGVGHVYLGGASAAVRAGLIGLVFAIYYVLTGSIWLPILAHIAFDILQGVMIVELSRKNGN